MALSLGSASATITLDASNFIKNAKSAGDSMGDLQKQSNSVSSNGGFLNWVNANSNALTMWGQRMMITGGIITGAFAAPIIAGSRAAWGQVDAVEQATIAMNAYADSTEQVDTVLADLLDYARSDMGVLFSRQELFSAAQSMLIYGASIEEVTGYTEILSRSVGLGLSDWDSLNTIIGRVGSTGRLTGNDFDMLKQRGFDLDESLRNTNITWEELFAALDKGIPADALAGQADTIRGKSIRLQSALRGLGLAFLGVDSETSKFIEGGLGWQMMRGMEKLTDLMKRAAPAVEGLGKIVAAILRPIGNLVDMILRLPQPVQTAILLFAAGTGVLLTFGGAFLTMLPIIASVVGAFGTLGGVAGILGGIGKAATMALGPVRLLGAGVMAIFANPILLAGAIAIGAAILAYKTNFMGFGDMVRDALGWVKDLWAALQLVFGKTHHTTGNFDIVTTADNVWDQWQLQEDGTWKNASLGVTSTADDGTLKYMGLDENTGKWMVVHISKDGEEVPGEILSSSQSESDPTKFFMEIQLAGGEKITAVYDEVEGTYAILEDPAEMIIDTADTEKNLSNVEMVAGRVETMAHNIEQAWLAFNAGIEGTRMLIQDLLGWLGDVKTIADGVGDALEFVLGPRATDEDGDGSVSMGEQYGEPLPEPGSPGAPSLTKAEGRAGHDQAGPVNDNTFSTGRIGGLISSIKWLTDNTTPAVNEVGKLDGSIGALGGTSQVATGDVTGFTSTVPVMGSAMQTADTQVKGAGTSIGSTLQGIAASALTHLTSAKSTALAQFAAMNAGTLSSAIGMQSGVAAQMAALQAGVTSRTTSARASAVSQFAAMQSGTVANAIGMQAGVSARMAALQSVVTSQASSARANAVSQFSSMSSGVAGKFMGMQAQSAVQMALMASTASTQGGNTMSNLVGAIAGGMARVYAALSAVPRAVSSVGGSAASTAYSIGANISGSFASGMWAYMGQIAAAANAMVNTASAALRAKAMIASPSKLFKQYGAFVGEGFELGIRDSIPDIARAADAMLGTGMPSPAFSAPLHVGGYGGGQQVVNNYYQQDVKVMTSAEWEAYKQKSDRGDQVHSALTTSGSSKQYRGRVR